MREVLGGGILSPSDNLRREVSRLREETEAHVREFLTLNSLRYIIGLIGDSDTDEQITARNQILLRDFFETLPDRHLYAVQTGGTKDGLPEYGIELARDYDIPTIGVYPAAASHYALAAPRDTPADLVIETPDLIYGRTSFGAETPTFVSLLHGAVALGGGYGTRAEISTILRVNKSRVRALRSIIKSTEPDSALQRERLHASPAPIFLAPISRTGKTADEVAQTRPFEDIGRSMPDAPLYSGADAATFLHERLTSATDDVRRVL